ncbi:hypothetical protein M427DRAFT_75468 [Gonapodya prolifera JEL478]|uniref:Uncharacterized protein n=1 Tax=Gonapodya prolifera (strain JEL478) TaxID=1344416 RepID=A0A138ZZA1_GONPJ|nr:hypothetical protein M427DRAFT_75468 [Gonapodya prolifera JEL478]|eukprot:KXS09463.1 hypothetical protein M427DRAFT_75468 [Gonapodya prolifera JEL478]
MSQMEPTPPPPRPTTRDEVEKYLRDNPDKDLMLDKRDDLRDWANALGIVVSGSRQKGDFAAALTKERTELLEVGQHPRGGPAPPLAAPAPHPAPAPLPAAPAPPPVAQVPDQGPEIQPEPQGSEGEGLSSESNKDGGGAPLHEPEIEPESQNSEGERATLESDEGGSSEDFQFAEIDSEPEELDMYDMYEPGLFGPEVPGNVPQSKNKGKRRAGGGQRRRRVRAPPPKFPPSDSDDPPGKEPAQPVFDPDRPLPSWYFFRPLPDLIESLAKPSLISPRDFLLNRGLNAQVDFLDRHGVPLDEVASWSGIIGIKTADFIEGDDGLSVEEAVAAMVAIHEVCTLPSSPFLSMKQSPPNLVLAEFGVPAHVVSILSNRGLLAKWKLTRELDATTIRRAGVGYSASLRVASYIHVLFPTGPVDRSNIERYLHDETIYAILRRARKAGALAPVTAPPQQREQPVAASEVLPRSDPASKTTANPGVTPAEERSAGTGSSSSASSALQEAPAGQLVPRTGPPVATRASSAWQPVSRTGPPVATGASSAGDLVPRTGSPVAQGTSSADSDSLSGSSSAPTATRLGLEVNPSTRSAKRGTITSSSSATILPRAAAPAGQLAPQSGPSETQGGSSAQQLRTGSAGTSAAPSSASATSGAQAPPRRVPKGSRIPVPVEKLYIGPE